LHRAKPDPGRADRSIQEAQHHDKKRKNLRLARCAAGQTIGEDEKSPIVCLAKAETRASITPSFF
jgi:hypothetical protein